MADDDRQPEAGDWDRIHDHVSPAPPELLLDPIEGGPAPTDPGRQLDRPLPALQLVAAAWGDLVAVLAVCTAALVVVTIAGYGVKWQALPWAAGLAAAWWFAAAAATLLVRHATPGMLMAGVAFDGPVAPRRIPLVVLLAAVQLVLGGIPAGLALAAPSLAWVAGARLRSTAH